MTYTIRAAQWGNADRTSAVLFSEEVGAVAISERDTPEEWAGFLQWQSYGHPVEGMPQAVPPLALDRAGKIDRLQRRLGMSVDEIKAVLAEVAPAK